MQTPEASLQPERSGLHSISGQTFSGLLFLCKLASVTVRRMTEDRFEPETFIHVVR